MGGGTVLRRGGGLWSLPCPIKGLRWPQDMTDDARLEQLRGARCSKIYRENVTGARADRRELLKLLAALAPGDVVTVTRIDRLARSTFDLFGTSNRPWTPRHNSALSWNHGPTPAPAPGA